MANSIDLPSLPGARVAERSFGFHQFLDDHLKPLLFWKSYDIPELTTTTLNKLLGTNEISPSSEEEFWHANADNVFQRVSLKGFVLVDWFPRAPGVACSRYAERFLRQFRGEPLRDDPILGAHYTPRAKGSLVEDGGIGTIRLRPRKIDGKDSWYATALKGQECHRGIPLVIPDTVLRQSGMGWGETAIIKGQIRFMQDASLDDTASYVHHSRPLIVFVDYLKGVKQKTDGPVLINPWSSLMASPSTIGITNSRL